MEFLMEFNMGGWSLEPEFRRGREFGTGSRIGDGSLKCSLEWSLDWRWGV